MATSALTFTCVRCDADIPVLTTDDQLPDIQVKLRRVQRQCRSCGHMVRGLEAPDECPNESCSDPATGWASAERVVSDRVTVPVCTACQDDLDTADELKAVLEGT